MAIETLLNRIELGNRFTRAIAVGNPREFSAGDKEEQEIAETCNRLIKNAIVCWNYLRFCQTSRQRVYSLCQRTTQIRYAACKILSAVRERERTCSRR